MYIYIYIPVFLPLILFITDKHGSKSFHVYISRMRRENWFKLTPLRTAINKILVFRLSIFDVVQLDILRHVFHSSIHSFILSPSLAHSLIRFFFSHRVSVDLLLITIWLVICFVYMYLYVVCVCISSHKYFVELNYCLLRYVVGSCFLLGLFLILFVDMVFAVLNEMKWNEIKPNTINGKEKSGKKTDK